MKRAITFLFIVVFLPFGAQSQELLTVKEAVEIALENNYSIRLSKNDLLVAKENSTYGNAGMLPSVTANLNQNNSVQNSHQVQNNGEQRSLDNAKNNSLNYGVSIGWTVFDGMGMFARYERLQELEKQGGLQLKRMVLTTIGDVITLYYTIVEQQNLLSALDSNIAISRERLRTAENRFSIGKAARLEVLNVQVNLNEDISGRLRQAETVRNLKTELNSLLARNLDIDFYVEDDVHIDDGLIYADLLDRASRFNPDLQLIALNKRLAELDLKNVRASRYPTVRVSGGYNFSRSESSLGFVAHSNARGLTYGVTASLNIFDGFNQRRNERIAKIQIDNASLQIEQQRLLVETAIKTAYETYLTNMELSKLEERNEDIARQNLEITLAKYTIGSISSVEFRDAQENFINAISRNNSARLQAKLSEVQLKELIGQIDF
ncbi:outer membrane protein TolC [Sphingobacterium allocomposti]|uniref:Outer membrane protein TolC n=1 Tax=Sphingobacterium allocomposti TaxID=415956 RepID=A0A5S5DBM6_9SPHI|nr:TolC family protein [Sphingobacterium composti Yoo et al. 2007 non Ten et al. 2007]TYP92904.1 outer membrane protein TolC [Sphingobacterium composti Yoo et al. 2007 non Ten et al. 2007]